MKQRAAGARAALSNKGWGMGELQRLKNEFRIGLFSRKQLAEEGEKQCSRGIPREMPRAMVHRLQKKEGIWA